MANEPMADEPMATETQKSASDVAAASYAAGPKLNDNEKREALLSRYVVDPEVKGGFLGMEPILVGRIVHLGLPVIIGMLTQTAINIFDALMVGRLPDEIAVAGTGALTQAQILLWAFGGFLSAIAVGTQALTARRYGEGSTTLAGRVLSNSLVLAVGSSIVVTAIALAVNSAYFHFLMPGDDLRLTREVGISYSQVRLLGIFSMVMMASYKSFYDGVGRVRVHMTIAVIMNISNIVLNYGLIFGNLGLPRLEVEGAAWASVIASVFGLVIMASWTMRKGDRKAYRVYSAKNLDGAVAWSIAKLSLGAGLATTVVMTGFWLFGKIVGMIDVKQSLPGINFAANGMIISVSMLCFMTCIGFGTSTATLVSQSLGARNPGLARRYGWQSVKIIVVAMSLLGLVVVIWPEPILQLFLPASVGSDATLKLKTIAVAAPTMRMVGFGAPLAGAALVLTQALYGAGQSRFVMVVELLLHFLCLVPLAWLLGVYFDYGLQGCWMATGIYGIGLVIAMGLKFWRGDWDKETI